MPKAKGHSWQFKRRFRRNAFGWKSQPAITRLREAVSEIKKVARSDPALGAEGAVAFIERISPAIEHVDGSSGSIGAAVNNAIAALVPIMAGAEVDDTTRASLLERLYQAHADDQIPYIEHMADYWGQLCASRDMASRWADRLIGTTRLALSPDPELRGHYHGSSACLSALFAAERYDEIVELLEAEKFWPYKRWAVKALAARGDKAEAIRCAEASRSPWASDLDIDRLCEEILVSSGFTDEAYRRYGLQASRAGTYLAWFRAVANKCPDRDKAEILADLVALTPGEEGKWFAAAKSVGLFDDALELARRSPTDPRTLTRAARDFAEKQPAFAAGAGVLALHWIAHGYGYEITGADVLGGYRHAMAAAANDGSVGPTRDRIRTIATSATDGAHFIMRILRGPLGL